jgi:hypothetical protein
MFRISAFKVKVKEKVNFTLKLVMNAQKDSRSIVLFLLALRR